MNGVLFRRSARSLWKTWVVFAAVLSLYVSMITAMFDPKLNATLDEIVTAMPQLMNMVGMQAGSSSLGGFLINYLYGFLLLLLLFDVLLGLQERFDVALDLFERNGRAFGLQGVAADDVISELRFDRLGRNFARLEREGRLFEFRNHLALASVFGYLGLKTFLFQIQMEQLSNVAVILYDQNLLRHR